MLTSKKNTISIDTEDMQAILFRNFSGKPSNFNPNGEMGNFTIVLNDKKAEELKAEGLNVKRKLNRDGDEEWRLQIFVRFDKKPPKIYRKVGTKSIELTEETVALLDDDEIEKADLIIDPSVYDFNGRHGKKAYLHRGYFTVAEDQYADRYLNREDDVPFEC